MGEEKAEELVIHNPYKILKGEKLFLNVTEADGEDKMVQLEFDAS